MIIIEKRIKELKNPKILVHKLYGIFLEKFAPLFSDRLYLKLKWKHIMGYSLDLKNPRTFNEKLQWLKLYNRKPEYTQMVDKLEAKKYVANIVGEEYIIPTLAVYESADEIDFDLLPNQFVLKCTHDSGSVVICRDKTIFDKQGAIKILKKGLKTNFYYQNREWPYKNVKRRIIAEKYMEDSESLDLRDYKFFCFDGIMKALFIASDRQNVNEETKFDFFDKNFKHLDIKNGHPNSTAHISKPDLFDKMKEIAEKLSVHIPHLRVDLYEVNGRAYFGELTFYHWSGMVPLEPKEWDLKFGDWITLPEDLGGAKC